MALHIKDAEAEGAVRELAQLRGSSLTDAVRDACREMLKDERRKIPVKERLAKVYSMIDAMPDTGEQPDKAFFDELWGETD